MRSGAVRALIAGLALLALLAVGAAGLVKLAHALRSAHAEARLQATLARSPLDPGPSSAAWAPKLRRVLVIGDSRVARWTPPPALSGAVVRLSGVAGETSRQTQARFARDALAVRPDVLMIAVGVNDLTAAAANPPYSRRVVEGLLARLAAMAAEAEAAGIETYVATIPRPARLDWRRRWLWGDGAALLVHAVNNALRDGAAGGRVIDMDHALAPADPAAPLPAALAADPLHFRPAAYEMLNRLLRERLS